MRTCDSINEGYYLQLLGYYLQSANCKAGHRHAFKQFTLKHHVVPAWTYHVLHRMSFLLASTQMFGSMHVADPRLSV